MPLEEADADRLHRLLGGGPQQPKALPCSSCGKPIVDSAGNCAGCGD